ncbi:MAG: 2'-5' RNA ligase family protein [Ornithinimicrobium sp.]
MTKTSNTVGVVLLVPNPLGSQVTRLRARIGDALGMAIPTHITLLPPTRVSAGQSEALEEHLAQVASHHEAPTIKVNGTGTFRPTSDVVFLAISEGVQACADLNAAVCSGPVTSPSVFPFHPHITLAHDLAPQVLDHVAAEYVDVRAEFRVPQISLYRLDDQGRWQVRAHYPCA